MLNVQNDKKQLIIAITNHELAVGKKYYVITVPNILVRNYQVEK